MPTVHEFHVVPVLPEPLQGLRAIALNLRWAWDHDTIELFRRLDRDGWDRVGRNPVRLLSSVSQERLREAAQDEAFLAHLDRVARSNDAYLRTSSTWFRQRHADLKNAGIRIAYFSMEFGITECMPIYSGGLGVLSGDHMKSSSDLDLPLVGVGLLYQQGYFRQSLNAEGWQQERYPENDFYNMPLEPTRDGAGEPVRICLSFPGRRVYVQVWKAQVGRVPLYLLDTNIAQNSAADQGITNKLYGGDNEMRLQQEIVLGIGGMRALMALGIQPTVCHMNEGHSAFLSLERVRMLMQEHGVDFWTAQEACAAGNLFTTHTPVPAGFDLFTQDVLVRYFEEYVADLGISFDDFLAIGRISIPDPTEQFNMALLALHNSHHCNAVSRLHGTVSRRMVQAAFPEFPEEEVPITYVTNGIHTRSFVSLEMADVLDRYLGSKWSQSGNDSAVWAKVDQIPDEELWEVKDRRRERLVSFLRRRLRRQYEWRGKSEYEIRETREILNPDALTIGFARRFATYKRATLILSDPERIVRLLNDPHQPVQILIAGKAHPKDDGGKELIRQIVEFTRREDVKNRIFFLEDYDLTLARHLVQGVDVWLNTPRRPMEASGTSGMKVLANGGLNLSILDGWWAEGYDPEAGWAIGGGEEHADPHSQDLLESSALYDLLEKEVVPLFFDRGKDGIPRGWLKRMRYSMRHLCPVFNTNRMVAEYADRFYIPATQRYQALTADGLARTRELVAWKFRVGKQWANVSVRNVETDIPAQRDGVSVGQSIAVHAYVSLGELSPDDVVVQAFRGPLDIYHQISGGVPTPLALQESSEGTYHYAGVVPCDASGLQGLSVRVLPSHPDAVLPHEMPLIVWE